MHPSRSTTGSRLVVLLCLCATAVAACSAQGAADGRPVVAVAFFPIEEIVRHVGGDAIRVATLVPPGQEAHEYDPTPKQLNALEHADVVVYLGDGFQPSLEKAIQSLPGSVRRVDLLKGISLLPVTGPLAGTSGEPVGETLGSGKDPHVWLDPANMATMSAAVLDALRTVAPGNAATFDANAATFDATLADLGRAFTTGLSSCRTRVLVTSHRAFGYLAAAEHLTQVSIAGVSPTDEPSAKTIKAVADYARRNAVTTIFFQSSLPADLAATVAGEIGARTAVLDSLESPTGEQRHAGEGYDSIMRRNLTALRVGLGCV